MSEPRHKRFEFEGGIVNPGFKETDKATWTNVSGAAKWIHVSKDSRQYVASGETVELTDERFEEMKADAGVVVEDDETSDMIETPAVVMDIFWAIKMGITSKVESIIAESDDPKAMLAEHDDGGHTVMHWAAKRGDIDMFELLASHHAPLFVASKDKVGMQPMHWACTEGRLEIIRFLVDKGGIHAVNCADLSGCTPLLIAAQYGHADVVAYLIKINADTTILDKNKDSAMHWAAYKGELEIVGLLDYLGLPVGEPDSFGQTPLHLAALRGNFSVVEYLVMDCSAPLLLKDVNEKTPLDLAIKKQNTQVVKFLKQQEEAAEGFFGQGLFKGLAKLLSFKTIYKLFMGDGRTQEGMRFPIILVFCNTTLEHYMYPAFFLRDNVLADYNGLHMVSFLCHIILWVVFLKAWLGDPGWIGPDSHGGVLGRAYANYFDELVNPTRSRGANYKRPTLCHTCRIQRPLRSKHCRTCRKCVSLFDHHCPYIGNCVGRDNYRWFFGYAFMFFVCSSLWEITAIIYLQKVDFDYSVLTVALYFFPFWCFSIMLSSYHANLSFTNLTTNEQMNFGRYSYLGPQGNLFDKGVANNCLVRFFPTPADPNVEEIGRLLNSDGSANPGVTVI